MRIYTLKKLQFIHWWFIILNLKKTEFSIILSPTRWEILKNLGLSLPLKMAHILPGLHIPCFTPKASPFYEIYSFSLECVSTFLNKPMLKKKKNLGLVTDGYHQTFGSSCLVHSEAETSFCTFMTLISYHLLYDNHHSTIYMYNFIYFLPSPHRI